MGDKSNIRVTIEAPNACQGKLRRALRKRRQRHRLDRDFLSALEVTVDEWNSQNDEEAYSDL
ncbi:MAG: hypothetical protein ACREQX_02830 [Candidatus Binataceae bacterium]